MLLEGWIFEESKREAVLKALEGVAGVEVTQNENAVTVESEPVVASENANAVLTVEPYKKSILVKGDTKEVNCEFAFRRRTRVIFSSPTLLCSKCFSVVVIQPYALFYRACMVH